MEITITNLKPVSTNNKFLIFKNKFYPSKEYKKFKKDFRRQIIYFRKELKQFAKKFRESDSISCEIIFLLPEEKLITKKNNISKRSIDLDNILKILIDLVFDELEKFNPKINDAFICDLVAKKRINNASQYDIIVKMNSSASFLNFNDTSFHK